MIDLMIIGAGPCGLAAGISARRAGLDYLIIEKTDVAGTMALYPRHMTFFSTADKLSLGGHPFNCAGFRPSRAEATAYYRHVAAAEHLRIRLWTEAVDIRRQGEAFGVRVRSADGLEEELQAYHIAVATGYLQNPVLLGVPGEDLPMVSHWYTEAGPWIGRRVVIIGGRNSAVDAAIDLARHGVAVTLVHRRPELSDRIKPWILPDFQALVAAGQIAVWLDTRVRRIRPEAVIVETAGVVSEIPGDVVFALTGYRPDHRLLAELGVTIDPESGVPGHDEQTMETNVPGLFLAGVIAAGFDANKIFIENGREHGDRIVSAIQQRQRFGR